MANLLVRTLASLVVASVTALVLPVAASAKPGDGNGNTSPGKAVGAPHKPGKTGNPQAPGAKKNPHPQSQGSKGNPHPGQPPHGQAKGRQPSSGGSGEGGGGGTASGTDDGSSSGGSGKARGGGRSSDRPPGKTTICHHTSSETNPYVRITVSNQSLAAHSDHHSTHTGHDDLIPAPGGSCDESDPAVGEAIEETTGAGGTGESVPPGSPLNPAPDSDGTGDDDQPEGEGTRAAAEDGTGEDTLAAALATAASTPGGEDNGGSLPFTGGPLGAILMVGILLLSGGWLVRRLRSEGPGS